MSGVFFDLGFFVAGCVIAEEALEVGEDVVEVVVGKELLVVVCCPSVPFFGILWGMVSYFGGSLKGGGLVVIGRNNESVRGDGDKATARVVTG